VSIANNNFFLRRSEKKSIKRNADYCSFFTRTFAIRMECCDSTFPEPANIPWKMNSFFTAHLPMHPPWMRIRARACLFIKRTQLRFHIGRKQRPRLQLSYIGWLKSYTIRSVCKNYLNITKHKNLHDCLW